MKLKRYIFILMVLVGVLVFPSRVRATDLKLTYNEDWNDCFRWVKALPSYDNNGNMDGYLFFGNQNTSSIVKHGLNNEIIYKKNDITSNLDVQLISSDLNERKAFIITGYDENDNVIFEKQYGGNGNIYDYRYFNSYDNNGNFDGYILFFRTTFSDLTVDPGYVVVKFDLKGNIVWEKNVNNYIKTGELYYIVNGNIVSVFEVDYNNMVRRINFSTNQIMWEKNIGFSAGNINYSYDKNGVIDGIVVIAGGDDNNYVGTLIKYDLNGNEVFRASYDSMVESFYVDVISSYLPDGSYDGYLVTGGTYGDVRKTFIIKYDYNGNKIFEKTYSNNLSFPFNIIDNYDKNGSRNGYLLYDPFNIPQRVDSEISTYYNDSCTFPVAKYTYNMFPVAKEETSEGTITVKSDAYPGEMVKVKVLVKEGYSLARIIVKDESGKEIKVNSDGTFVMPEGKVTVSAIYKRVTNPDTVSAAYMVLGVVLLIAVGSLIVIRQRNKENI